MLSWRVLHRVPNYAEKVRRDHIRFVLIASEWYIFRKPVLFRALDKMFCMLFDKG